jgi:hypothetical protein
MFRVRTRMPVNGHLLDFQLVSIENNAILLARQLKNKPKTDPWKPT